jgi:NADPH2:quinone reductase
MRAVDIKNGAGPADSLFINESVETPTPKKGEILVRVKAFGLNRMDISQREGRYPLPPQAPKTLGVEFSGIVESLGESTTGFKEGEKVFGLAYGGAYAEFIAVSETMCIHLPDELSFEQAAGIPETWITATQALWTIGCFKPGEKVLIHAGASGVGICAIQLAVSHGASAIFTTAGSDEKIDFCTNKLGATAGLNYHKQDFAAEILEATNNEGVDVVVDFVGQSHFNKNIKVAAKDGRIVLLALVSGHMVNEVDLGQILFKRLRIEGTTLRSRTPEYQEVIKNKFLEEGLPGLRSGKYKIFIEKTFSWKDIAEAHKLMESNKTSGKIICFVD